MSVPTFLQSKTYSTNAAANSHQITLDNPVTSQGGSVGPSTLIATLSYDGASGDIITGITDSDGNTWYKGTSATNSSNTNGEMWYAYNVKGGGSPTITIALSASVKMTACIVEVDQIRPVSALDLVSARIDTTNSSARTSAASISTKRQGQLEVVIGGIGWQDSTLTCTNGGSGFAGTLVTLKDGSSNIGVGMVRRTADLQNIAGSNSIGRFTMGASGTVPCAVMSLSFFRDGIVTSTDEDGWIDDIEGSPTLYKTTPPDLVYMSSASAPNGGTGGSEKSNAYSFFPDYSSYLLPGVTIGENLTLTYGVSDGFDDGTGYFAFAMYLFKNAALGSTLDLGDETFGGGDRISIGLDPATAGFHTVPLTKSADYNTAGYTNAVMTSEGDANGGTTNTYSNLNEYSGSVPQYLTLQLSYPVLAVKPNLLALMGVG